MRKFILVGIAVTALLAAWISSIIFLVDYDKAYSDFLVNIKDLELSETLQVKSNKLPVPYLSIKDANHKGKLELQNIDVKFSLISLLRLNPKVSEIDIISAKLYLDENQWNIVNHDRLIADLIAKKIEQIDFDIKKLYIFDHDNNLLATIDNFVYRNGNSFAGYIRDLGKFSGQLAHHDQQTNFQIHVTGDNYDFELSEFYQANNLLSGSGSFKIKNLANVLSNNLSDTGQLFSKINRSEPVNVSFDIAQNNEIIQLGDIVIVADNIAGQGQINLSRANDVSNIIKLQFSKFNFDSSESKTNNTTSSRNSSVNSHFSFLNKLLIVDVSIDQSILQNNLELHKIAFQGHISDGKFLIENFSGKINNDGEFKVSGNIAQNPYRNIFDGKIFLKASNINDIFANIGLQEAVIERQIPFVLTSDLKCTIIDFYLMNLTLRTEDFKVSGNISSKFIGSQARANATLNISAMNLDKNDYPIVSPFVKFTKTLTENMKDSQYLSKFSSIRLIPYIGNFDLSFNDLSLSATKLGKLDLLIKVAPSMISIDNLYINDGVNSASVALKLIASGLKPELNIKINDGILHSSFLTPRRMLDLRNKILKDFSIDKITMNLDCSLSKFFQNDLEFDDVKFHLDNDNILFNISSLQGRLLGGTLESKGSILLEPFTWNFVYALNSIDLNALSKTLPRGFLDNTGGLSINGMLTTNGDSLEQLLYNLYTNSTLIVKDAKISRFSIDDFIYKITDVSYNAQNLNDDLKYALVVGQTNLNSLTSQLELTKGIVSIKSAKFNTNNSAGTATGAINIYNYSLDLNSMFAFKLNRATTRTRGDDVFKMNIKWHGNIFEPSKSSNVNDLEQVFSNKNP